MDKNIIREELSKLTEINISGEKVTKRVQSVAKKQNKAYYKDVKKKMGDYDKALKSEDDDKIDPVKTNIEDKTKEYHDEMEIRNGQEMLNYDNTPSEQFTDRAIKGIEGDSTTGNKTYTGKENGNTESVWGASNDDFGKDLAKTIRSAKKKRDDGTPARHQFGDDIETAEGDPQVKTKKTAIGEGMKRIRFKTPFDGVGNALKLIPEAFKVDGKKFELTDGNETYKVTWKGTVTEGKANVSGASDKNMISEDFAKIKHLMGYKPEDTLGTLSGEDRVNENLNVKTGMSQGFVGENEDVNEYNAFKDADDDDVNEGDEGIQENAIAVGFGAQGNGFTSEGDLTEDSVDENFHDTWRMHNSTYNTKDSEKSKCTCGEKETCDKDCKNKK